MFLNNSLIHTVHKSYLFANCTALFKKKAYMKNHPWNISIAQKVLYSPSH